MEVVIAPTADEVGRLAAAKVAQVCRSTAETGRTPVLGVATGSSPLGLYASLAPWINRHRDIMRDASAFALDEYVGLPKDHPESYASVIARTVTEPFGLDPSRVHVPDGSADDLNAAAQAFEDAITAAGGVDVQILGIGSNGHIGFNEPGSSFGSRTRVKTLTEQTRRDNQRFFDSLDAVPTHCLTQGLGTIMDARHVVLVAQGAAKADAIAALVEGPVTASCPASILQFHRHATIVITDDAASGLTAAAHNHYQLDNLPEVQRWTHELE